MASSVSRKDCVDSAVRAGASSVEAEQIVGLLLEQKKRLAATGQMDRAAQQLSQLWSGKVDDMQRKALMQRRHAAINIIKRQDADAFLASVKAQGFTAADGIEAMLVGSAKRFNGARASISSDRQGIIKSWVGPMLNELQDAADGNALALIREDRAFHDDIVREMRTPGSTTNEDARAVADIFARYTEQARVRLNAAGADIGDLQGWTPQAHDPWKLLKGGVQGKEDWITFVAEKLDVERSFPDAVGDPLRLREILGSVYDSIATGHDGHVRAAERGQTTGPRNLASGMGKHRVLHFADADAALAYNERYGQGNIIDGMVRHLGMSARKVALMERLGPNPQAMLESIVATEVRLLGEEARLNPELAATKKELENSVQSGTLRGGKVLHWLAELTGETNWAASPTLARWASLARATQTLSKLGGAALSAVSDVFIKASAMRVNGLSWPESLTRSLTQYVHLYSGEERKIARQLGTFLDATLGDMHARWDAGDTVHGKLGVLQNTLFKWSGLNWITESGKAGYAMWLSQHLGEVTGKTFDQIDAPRKAMLKYHGIDAARWDVLRLMTETTEDGRVFFVPGKAESLPDAALEGLLPEKLRSYEFYRRQEKEWRTMRRRIRGMQRRAENQSFAGIIREDNVPKSPHRPTIPTVEQWERQRKAELNRQRNRLQTESLAMISDETTFAIIEPDEKTRAFMRQGTRPGTVAGELWRTIMQFKSFPIAYLQRAVGGRRWVRGDLQEGMRYGFNGGSMGDALTRDMGGLVGYTLSAMTFGYAAMTLKDIAKGRTPRDPRKWETWLAAAVQSGGAGIYGDFFLAKANRFGNDLAGTLAGPLLTSVGKALTIPGMLIRREGVDAGEQAIRTVLDNAPFINLWYTRAALDWTLLYHVREMMSPGTLNRMERKMKTEFGQEMLVSPSRHIKRGGGLR